MNSKSKLNLAMTRKTTKAAAAPAATTPDTAVIVGLRGLAAAIRHMTSAFAAMGALVIACYMCYGG